jgi:hypothetical protein
MGVKSKDGHCITQKDTQPSQTCSGGFIKTQLYAICCCFFAIGEYNPIQSYFTIIQKDSQPSQICFGSFTNTQLFAHYYLCLFVIWEYDL